VISEHTSRFTPNGIYKGLAGKSCAVVNITRHDPPPIDIPLPAGFFATLYHFVVGDLAKPRLVWRQGKDLHEIVLHFGKPMQYNLATKKLIAHPDDSVNKFQKLLN